MTTTPQLTTGTYAIDPARSSVTAKARALFGLTGVTATFALRSGTIVVAADPADSTAAAVLDAGSFVSGHATRDRHVVSDEFLDAPTYPDISFTSRTVTPAGEGWTVLGDLTVRDTTRPVELAVTPVGGAGQELTVRATTSVNRHEFGVTHAKGMAGGVLALTLEIVATRT